MNHLWLQGHMPFDPISWAVGFALSKAAQKGLDVAFGSSLQRALTNEVEAWVDALPENARLHAEALLSPIATHNQRDTSASVRLKERLLSLEVPSENEWFEALLERWKAIHDSLGENAQPFFRLSEREAANHLASLARRLRRRCSQDEKIALPHVVESLGRIEVTLAEYLQLRSLKALPGQLKLDGEAIRRTTNVARALAVRRGWESCWESRTNFSEFLEVLLIFGEDQWSPVAGVLRVDHKQLALWSSLQDQVAELAVAGVMFGPPLFAGIDENWNSIVEFVGQTARSLYPDSVREGWFGISARYDLKRIGVPFPSSCVPDADDERVVRMRLGEHDSVPFLTFGPDILHQLIGPGQVEAAGHVAGWLRTEWGVPTVLPRDSK